MVGVLWRGAAFFRISAKPRSISVSGHILPSTSITAYLPNYQIIPSWISRPLLLLSENCFVFFGLKHLKIFLEVRKVQIANLLFLELLADLEPSFRTLCGALEK